MRYKISVRRKTNVKQKDKASRYALWRHWMWFLTLQKGTAGLYGPHKRNALYAYHERVGNYLGPNGEGSDKLKPGNVQDFILGPKPAVIAYNMCTLRPAHDDAQPGEQQQDDEPIDEEQIELVAVSAVDDEAGNAEEADFVAPQDGTIASVLQAGETIAAPTKRNDARTRLNKAIIYCSAEGWIRGTVDSTFGGRSAKTVAGVVVEYWLTVTTDGLQTKHRVNLDKSKQATIPSDMTEGAWALIQHQ